MLTIVGGNCKDNGMDGGAFNVVHSGMNKGVLCKMAIRAPFISSKIGSRSAVLAINLAWEIPVERVVTASDARTGSLCNQALTVLVGLLKQKRSVVPSQIPSTSQKGLVVPLRVLPASLHPHGFHRLVVASRFWSSWCSTSCHLAAFVPMGLAMSALGLDC